MRSWSCSGRPSRSETIAEQGVPCLFATGHFFTLGESQFSIHGQFDGHARIVAGAAPMDNLGRTADISSGGYPHALALEVHAPAEFVTALNMLTRWSIA